MANVSEMLNLPTPIVLGGVVRKLRRLQISEVFGQFEQEIIDEHMALMQKVAGSLTGKDKVDYLVQMTQSMPSGSVLAGMAAEKTGTLAGITKLFKRSLIPEADKNGQPLPDPDLVLLMQENPNLIRQLTLAMVGIEAKTVKQEASGEVPLQVAVQSNP